jgi:hypothetical protein
MNATVTMKEEVRKDSLVREIPLDKIQESKTNPRTHYDEGALTELAANIKEHGVLQPVLLRLARTERLKAMNWLSVHAATGHPSWHGGRRFQRPSENSPTLRLWRYSWWRISSAKECTNWMKRAAMPHFKN